jgi:hypothetical protein
MSAAPMLRLKSQFDRFMTGKATGTARKSPDQAGGGTGKPVIGTPERQEHTSQSRSWRGAEPGNHKVKQLRKKWL